MHCGKSRHTYKEVGFHYLSDKVMAVIPEEDRTTEVTIRDNSDTVTTTLGLQWKRNEDAFIIPATVIPSDYPFTESNVLK